MRLLAFILGAVLVGCAANDTPQSAVTSLPPLSPEAKARLAQLHEGMRRSEVEAILGRPTSGAAVSVSGFASNYYWLTPDSKVRLDFSMKYPREGRESADDTLLFKPNTVIVKVGLDRRGRERWRDIPVTQVE